MEPFSGVPEPLAGRSQRDPGRRGIGIASGCCGPVGLFDSD
ncbi:hypothetical protein P3T43_004074 [Paraburkholderia sp. GAS41]